MPETQPEALAAILAEMRKAVAPMILGRPKIEAVSIRDVLQWADRIEAAAKREREAARGARDMRDAMEYAFAQKTPKVEQSGNAAALRKALESIIGNLAIHIQCGRLVAPGDHLSFAIAEAEAYIRDARAALAAPARNCDKYGMGDAKKMDDDFGAFCQRYGAKDGENCVGCPIKPVDNLCCHSAWMLLPAKGGDAK